MVRGTEVLYGNQWLPPQSSYNRWKNHRHLFCHQCGILMVNAWWLAASRSTLSETLVVSIEKEANSQSMIECHIGQMNNSYTISSVGNLVTNGSYHWVLRPPDQVSKTEYWPGTKILLSLRGNQWWLGKRSLVATNRTSVPLAMVQLYRCGPTALECNDPDVFK